MAELLNNAVVYLVVSLGFLASIASSTVSAQTTEGAQVLSEAGLPDDRQLERGHARIGRIVIEIDDIFEHEIRTRVYHLANSLHISTRAATIAEQLLFHSGDAYERRVLDETERLLRAQRYLNAAAIEPLSYHADNTVDIVVRVHDVWTLSPGISFGRKGGANSSRVELEDTNFLGLGKHIAVDRVSDPDRSAWRIAYTDPNLLGSHWRMAAAHAQLSDGHDSLLGFTRPFYSLDDRWSFELTGANSNSVAATYALGAVANQFDMYRKAFEMGGGWSSGRDGAHVVRFLGGLRYQSRKFAPLAATKALPDDRVLAYPWIGIERLQDEYLETRNFDQIGRTEDLNLGSTMHVEMGLGSSVFGATRDAVLLNGLLQSGAELAPEKYAIGSVAFNGRVEGHQLHNAKLDVAARYYQRQSPHRVLFASLNLTRAMHLDPEEQLLLGGDSGLRGYPLRYQAGKARALAVIEERFYSNWQPFKLFNVGAALFVDAGRTWGVDPIAGAPLGWLADAGMGLRLGNARSGLGNVLHIDLAFPLKKGGVGDQRLDSIKGMQLLIETKRSF